jgi:hypothetical protein
MVSSFLHILIVTPVLFAWLHARQARLVPPAPMPAKSARPRGNLAQQFAQ